MATIRLIPSAYTRSNTNNSYCRVTNEANMYYNTDHTANYATLRGRSGSNTTYYVFIHGFNFDDVPSNAIVNSFTVKISAYKSQYQSTGTNYRIRLASSPSTNSVISNTTVSSDLTTTSDVYTIPTSSLTWTQLKNYGSDFSIDVPLRRSSGSNYPYVYVYGAEILVDYTLPSANVTGVNLDQNTATIEVGDTLQLTETIEPSNAANKSVTWSSSNTSVATVSNGLVTGVSPGTATITVTTVQGSYTDTCVITVTPITYVQYKLATSFESGKKYLIVNTNSGSGYAMTSEANGSGTLKGVAITVSNNKISITQSTENKAAFTVQLENSSDSETIWLKNGTSYLYSDSTNHLRMDIAKSPRYWHYLDSVNLIWFFNGTSNEYGYTDTSNTYKYYLECSSSGDFTDNFVSTTSLANTSGLPPMYIFVEDDGSSDQVAYLKVGGSWVACSKVYKKVSGSWVEQSDFTNLFDSNTIYVKV